MSTYVQPKGTSVSTGGSDKGGHYYFQDVELSPATLKDYSLHARFDTKAYPQLGTKP